MLNNILKAKVFNKTSFRGANKQISEDGDITDEFNMVLATGFQEALKTPEVIKLYYTTAIT